MADAYDLLVRDQLIADAIALANDSMRAEAAANALDRMEHGNGSARRAEAERLRRAGDLCLLLGGYADPVLDELASGSMEKMLHQAHQDARRRKAIGGR